MSYELFRATLASRLKDKFPIPQLHDILKELDIVSSDYTIARASTDLIVTGGLPEIVKMYIGALAVENKAKGTLDNYLGILTHFFESVKKPFNAIQTSDIRRYLWDYQTTHNICKNTLEHTRVVINAFYSWCVDEEIMERNPAKKIPPIDTPESPREPIELIDLEYLRKACETLREKALIDFLYATGCRASECAALSIRDINFNTRAVKIRHGKGDKARITYFNAEAEVSLREYLNSRTFESDALFARIRAPHGHISGHSIREEVGKIRSRANIEAKVTPHVLRHTFATTLIANGTPVEHVQRLLGHSSLDTTMIYAKLNQQDIRTSHMKCLA